MPDKISTLRSIYSLISIIIILSVAVLPGSAAEYENKQQQYYAYATTTALPDTINFAAVGGWGCTPQTINTVNNILHKNPELILGLGDYGYYGADANCWLERVQPIDDKMKIAIGNQEVEMESKFAQYMEHFGLTNQYYSFDYQNVHFIVMSDYVPDEKGSEQYTFVQNDLAKAAADPNIDWIIPFFHRIMYARSGAGVVDQFDHNLEDIYHPIFEQYGIKLVLQSHSHTYERTYPLKINVEDSDDPIITSKDLSNYYYNTDGLVIATIGTGGATPTVFSTNSDYRAVEYRELYGFLNVEVSSDGTTLVGTFYDNDGGGQIKDQFTITKSE
jgi:Calcineurin-like phosphoesterase